MKSESLINESMSVTELREELSKTQSENAVLRERIVQLKLDKDVMKIALESIYKRKHSDGVGFARLCGRYESLAKEALITSGFAI